MLTQPGKTIRDLLDTPEIRKENEDMVKGLSLLKGKSEEEIRELLRANLDHENAQALAWFDRSLPSVREHLQEHGNFDPFEAARVVGSIANIGKDKMATLIMALLVREAGKTSNNGADGAIL